jgi:WD40 repeat protein
MDKSGDLLVAGGHQGWASVWGLGAARASGGEAEDVAPLMRAKLHSGWICDVQFLSREGGQLGGGGAPLLLSASNDAAVALWDVSRAATGNGKPFKLLESRDVHQSERQSQLVSRSRRPDSNIRLFRFTTAPHCGH